MSGLAERAGDSIAESPRDGADRKITVMRIIDRLNIGGPAIHAVVTSRGLDRSRFRTVLVVGSIEPAEGDMAYLLEDGGVDRIVSIASFGREIRPLRDLITTVRLYRLMREERPDIVHTHKAKAGTLGRIAAFICRVPIRVHTYHGHTLSGYFGATKSRVFQHIERSLARITASLVVPAPRLRDELAGRFRVAPAEQFDVVPLGFDLARFTSCEQLRGQLRRELGVTADQPLVGIVGRMVPVKDHATFVAAADLLARRRPDVRYVFVGSGELESQIRAEVSKRGLATHCHFLGWRRDLPRIYADLDVVTLSSINEGTPVSLIEAMAAGIPVVSTNVGGVADVLRDGQRGMLIPRGDPDALAVAIEKTLTPAARERATSIRASIHQEFGAIRLCRQLEELYLRLLDRTVTTQDSATTARG